jgi:N-acetylmuramoyl-L-alanine amidase
MIARAMVARSRGRWLAPIVLLGILVAIGLVVRAELRSSPRPPATPAVATSTSSTTAASPAFYVVKAGDSLSTIASKTGVPVGQLEALNPNVDPNVLHTGQRLRLRQ